ncbi:hypothetical protein [Nonomuraea longicatena]
MRRFRRAGLGVLFLALLASACASPAPKAILAIAPAQDGGVRLLLADCPDYRATDLSLFADVEGETGKWSVRNDGGASSVRDFGVLQDPPEGWTSTGSGLTALRDGVPYVARVDGGVRERVLKGRVPFTLADVRDLAEDQVLVWSGGEESEAVGRADFLRSEERCSP